jgi:hypothetical protein
MSVLHALAGLCGRAAGVISGEMKGAIPNLDLLFTAAQQHDVAGLLAAALLTGSPGELGEDVSEGLAICRDDTQLQARRGEKQLAEVLQRLADRGLAAMPFKGPLLAHTAYSDPGLRSALDLDIIVHPDDVSHVVLCLIDAGFRHQADLEPDGVAALRRYAGEYIMFRPNSLPVEPHWRPAPRTMAFDIDIDAMWRRARPHSFLGAPCYLPSPEDHLFLLALHGAKEQWHKMKWLVDIAALLTSHPRLDLAQLRARATAQGCRRTLDLALLLSHRLFIVPSAMPQTDGIAEKLAERVLTRLHRTAEPPPGPYTISSFHWLLRERRRDRALYATRTLFTPRVAHYQRLRLPQSLRWLHVLLKLPWDYIVTPTVGVARRLAAGPPSLSEPRAGRGRPSGSD